MSDTRTPVLAAVLVALTLGGVASADFRSTAFSRAAPGNVFQTRLITSGTMVQGELRPGASAVHRLEAVAGDLVVGPFEVQGGAPLWFKAYAPSGETVRATEVGAERRPTFSGPVGFVAPVTGMFRVEVIARGATTASWRWTPSMTSPAQAMAGSHFHPIITYESPRIVRLAKDVADGAPRAVEAFWEEVAASGSPIVEPVPASRARGRGAGAGGAPPDDDVFVTFVWRQIYDTYAVEILRPPFGPRDYRLMSRLPGTDVWYKTMKVHRTTRFEYFYLPNPVDIAAQRIRDPLNPRPFPDADDEWPWKSAIFQDPAAATRSVLSLPDAADESWARRRPARRGQVTSHTFDSPSLKARIRADIYVPPGYEASAGPYPLVVFYDGEEYVSGIMNAPTTLDNLAAAGVIRPPVSVSCTRRRTSRPAGSPTCEPSPMSFPRNSFPGCGRHSQ
jgi:enterochelin esterase family protein